MQKLLKQKVTKNERDWILYDVGNSGYSLMLATILPIYFNHLAQQEHLSSVQYLAYWGYATSLITLFVGFIGPIFGSIADFQGMKKKLFILFLTIGIVGCYALNLAHSWWLLLIVYVISKLGYSSSLIFYDAMLTDITTKERYDNISSLGYAWGYIGSIVPFVLSIGLVLGRNAFHLSLTAAMILAFSITATWWLINSLPLLKVYEQKYYIPKQTAVLKNTFSRLKKTLKAIYHQKHIFYYLISFCLYIDGVNTIISMATAYGKALGLGDTDLLLALLVTQFVAFPATIVFARITKHFKTSTLIYVCLFAYVGITLFAVTLVYPIQFWMLAIFVGLFQGGIQGLSRSYFAGMIPASQSGEYFGILDVCGKGAAFLGTFLVSSVTQITNREQMGLGVLIIIFIAGLYFFHKSVKLKA